MAVSLLWTLSRRCGRRSMLIFTIYSVVVHSLPCAYPATRSSCPFPAPYREWSLTTSNDDVVTDVCTLHPTSSHTTSFDDTILPSGATTPLEISPGEALLRPRPLHSPAPTRASSLRVHSPILSFPSPANSSSPSSHPALPPSRAPSPNSSLSSELPPIPLSHRWILHPRRGHAALNAGLKSLRGGELTVVGRPDDMTKAGGAELGQGELGEAEKRDLESGLAAMKVRNEGEGIECVPVWLDDKVHYSKRLRFIKYLFRFASCLGLCLFSPPC